MTTAVFILYTIVLVIFLVPAAAIVYHLAKFGLKKDFSKLMMSIFTVVAFVLISFSLYQMLTVDWSALFELLPFDLDSFSLNS